jgi:predicted nuclease with TOPRIM domain
MKSKLIVVLSALVLSLSGFMLYDSLNNELSQAEIQEQFSDLKSDYEFIQKDLEVAVNDANFSNKEIIAQKKRIETLLRKNNISQEELMEAKKIMRNISQTFIKNYQNKLIVLNNQVTTLDTEKQKLREENEKVTTEVVVLKDKVSELDRKIENEKVISKKKDELINYASKLSLSNFILRSFKVRNSGKEVETDKASRIDRIKFSFDINENILSKDGQKVLYMLIKKPSGEIATFSNKTSGVFNYNNRKMLYSDKTTLNYQKGQDQKLEFVWDNEDFSRGDYIMEVYEQMPNNTVMIGKVTKTLE